MGVLYKLNRTLEKLTGYTLVPTCKRGYLDRARAAVLRGNHVELLIDAGAANGDWTQSNTPDSFTGKMFSIEPQESRLAEVRAKASGDPRWVVAAAALGAEESVMDLHISKNQDSSSLLDSTAENEGVFGAGVEYVGMQAGTRVAPLDALLSENGLSGLRSWIKMDVQGYEDRLIAGASEAMKVAQVVEVELTGFPAYKAGVSMGQMVTLMVNHGFELASLDHIYYNNRRGLLAVADALFVRPEFRLGDICPVA
ncbi:MAG: FkbM family methyltransferase [Fimbriimonadaceae bacterium]|nr:FkbM family methyltransferase [Fimbriimonadaceae bacterium]